MSTPTAVNPTFSATCRHCGTRLSGSLSICPRCGGNASPAFASERRSTTSPRADASLGDAIQPPRPVPLFMPAGTGAPGEGWKPAHVVARQWGLDRNTGLALVAFVLLFGSYVLLTQRANRTPGDEAPMHMVIGSVAPGLGPNASEGSRPAQGTAGGHRAAAPQTLATTIPAPPKSAPLPSPLPLPEPRQPAAPVPEATAAAPALPAPPRAPTARQGHRPVVPAISQPRLADSPTHPSPGSGPDTRARQQHGASARELAAAWTEMEKSDLAGAHAALTRALADGPDNLEALMLRQDLLSRERARDAALNVARGCVAQHAWRCAWQNAGKALSIDTSNVEAKALVQRAIVDSGAINQPPGPGPDMPDGP